VDSVLPRLKGRRLSLLTGDAGPLAVGAAIHNHLGAKDTALGLCHRYLQINLTKKIYTATNYLQEKSYSCLLFVILQILGNIRKVHA
jgi:hypothetical protein